MENHHLETLAELEKAYHQQIPISEIWSKMHELAEAQFKPAIDLYKNFLDDDEGQWREEGIRLLGFHYELEADGEIINKIRHLLETDPEPGVRISAANALESRTSWPEETLLRAIKKDKDNNVVRAVFGALLAQAGLPPYRIMEEEKRIEEGQTAPSLSEIRRIFERDGIELDIPE